MVCSKSFRHRECLLHRREDDGDGGWKQMGKSFHHSVLDMPSVEGRMCLDGSSEKMTILDSGATDRRERFS